MSELPVEHSFVTPGAIVTALLGFVIGGISLGFDPFFAPSVIAIILCSMTLRSAAKVEHYMVQGLLRIFAVIGIMAAVGGVAVLLFPGLGVQR